MAKRISVEFPKPLDQEPPPLGHSDGSSSQSQQDPPVGVDGPISPNMSSHQSKGKKRKSANSSSDGPKPKKEALWRSWPQGEGSP